MRILGIPGSLRAQSYNRALLREAQRLAPAGVEIELYELDEIPLFNADVEATGDPEAVRRFKDAIRAADAILIATPEYNRGVPGVLKNAIDWASRPPFGSPLANKVVGIVGVGGRSGTAGAQAQLRDALSYPRAKVLEPSVLVPMAWERFDADGLLTDDVATDQLRALLDTLVTATKERPLAQVA